MDRRKIQALLDAPERRGIPAGGFEVRADGDTVEFRGYAAVFDVPYDVYGGPEMGGWTEIVDRHAFDVTLREKPDLHLLINHEGMPLARTKSGTLKLSTDDHGLLVRADLDRRDPDVQRLEVKMGRGDMDQMSFAFRTKRHEWDEENAERRLLEVSLHKGDVSIVNFGASPTTSATLRGLEDAIELLADLDVESALVEVRSLSESRQRLAAASSTLTGLLRGLTPPTERRLTVAEARRLIDAA